MTPTARTVTTAALVVAAALFSGCAPFSTACTAIGYGYDGPAVVSFSPAPPSDLEVAACFGRGCTPAPVGRSGETWDVPQRPPYLAPDEFTTYETELRIIATSAGDVLANDLITVPIEEDRGGAFGQCPGPFSFEPVVIDLGSS